MKKLFLLMLAMLALISCTTDRTEVCLYQPKVIDESGTLSNKTKELFTNFEFPLGVYPVLYHMDKIENLIETGSCVDAIFESIAKDKANYRDFKRVGFLVVVSDDPELIQVRIGKKYKSYCNLTGITAGPEYLQIQKSIATDGTNKALGSFLTMISQRIEERNGLSFAKKSRINTAIQAVNNTLDFVGTPSENFYGKAILKPMLVVLSSIYNIIGKWGWTLAFLFAAGFGIKFLYEKGLERIMSNSPVALNLTKMLMGLIFGLFFSISAAGAAFILSKGRMEDLIALNALGVPYIENLAIDPENFKTGNSIWLAIIFTVLWAMKLSVNDMFFLSIMPDEEQRAHFGKLSPFWQSFYNGMVSKDNIDLRECEAPYTEYSLHHMSEHVAQTTFGLTIAALFLLPKTILWIAIAIALKSVCQSMYKILALWSNGYFSSGNTEGKQMNMGIQFTVIGVICLISLCISPFLDPRPKREEVDYKAVKTEITEVVNIEGNYTFESETDGKSTYSSAMLKKTGDNTYKLLVTTKSDPVIFDLTYDTENMCLRGDDLNTGTVHYDKTLNTTKIIFKFNEYTTWTLSK